MLPILKSSRDNSLQTALLERRERVTCRLDASWIDLSKSSLVGGPPLRFYSSLNRVLLSSSSTVTSSLKSRFCRLTRISLFQMFRILKEHLIHADVFFSRHYSCLLQISIFSSRLASSCYFRGNFSKIQVYLVGPGFQAAIGVSAVVCGEIDYCHQSC